MYDRILRSGLFESNRWLDLPTDTHRLVYVALVAEADDFGNVEGGPRRLFRFMHRFAQVKSEGDAMKLMSDLADCDLVRRYMELETEFWHLPRFKNTRRYTSRKCPRSPWCGSDKLSSSEIKQQKNKANSNKSTADLP